MKPLNLFIPITRVDSAKRIVYGTLTHAVADKADEIIDYPTTKAAYQKWSDDAFDRSKGKSKGNLRAMHGNIAAGKFTDIVFDDENQKIEGAAYVADDNEWAKVESGVYTGFSHGGSYAKRWTDPENPKLKRYTPTLSEISLVDNPCVHTATFEFIKKDGSTELRKFNTNQEVSMTEEETKTAEIAKTAEAATTDEAPKEEPAVEAESHADESKVEKSERPQDKGGVVQGFQAKDGSFHLKKADALKRNEAIEVEAISQPALDALKNLAAAVSKAEAGVKKEEAAEAEPARENEVAKATEAEKPTAVEGETAKPETAKAAEATEVKKGMFQISIFADLLSSIKCLQQDTQWEAEWEGDNSELPAKLKAWLAAGGTLLVEMVGEETAELTAAKAAAGDLAKKGAAISAATKGHIEAMHKSASDHMGVMDKCVKALGMGGADEAQKSDKGELAKAADESVISERDTLRKTLGDMVPQINALVKRVEELESQPMPTKGVMRAVNKGEDSGNVSDGDAEKKAVEMLKGMSPEEQSMVLMKAALSVPKPITRI